MSQQTGQKMAHFLPYGIGYIIWGLHMTFPALGYLSIFIQASTLLHQWIDLVTKKEKNLKKIQDLCENGINATNDSFSDFGFMWTSLGLIDITTNMYFQLNFWFENSGDTFSKLLLSSSFLVFVLLKISMICLLN